MTGLPQSGSVKIDAAGIPAGGDTRSLIDDPRGYRTILLKIEPSPLGELHSHTEIEQIYILEGDFFEPLRELDEVAYLRFAAVYKQFETAEDFEIEISELRARRAEQLAEMVGEMQPANTG